MELKNITRLSALNGASLSGEEMSGLQVAMLQRKLEENLTSNLFFWGKIFGSKQDYLICFCLDSTGDFPSRKYYFWYASILIVVSMQCVLSYFLCFCWFVVLHLIIYCAKCL